MRYKPNFGFCEWRGLRSGILLHSLFFLLMFKGIEISSKYIVIPIEIWRRQDLSWIEKFIFIEVDNLSSNSGGNVTTVQYFTEIFNLSEEQVSQAIKNLIAYGMISEIRLEGQKILLRSNLIQNFTTMAKEKRILLYTDGSCYKGKGGCAYYLQFKEDISIIKDCTDAKGYSDTTISRMEMRAIVLGLKRIQLTHLPTLIITDSQFIANSINKGWVYRWERQDFEGRRNKDLWVELLQEWRRFDKIQILHTRGHNKGIEFHKYGNGIVDELCSYKNFENYEKDEII